MTKSTRRSTTPSHRSSKSFLHISTGGGTSDNLNQFTGNGGLTLTVVQDLELVDHLSGVLRGVLSKSQYESR